MDKRGTKTHEGSKEEVNIYDSLNNIFWEGEEILFYTAAIDVGRGKEVAEIFRKNKRFFDPIVLDKSGKEMVGIIAETIV